MRRSRPAAAVLALLCAAVTAAAGPRLEVGEEGRPVLTALPPILADPAVAAHLKTGLTTSFDFRLGPRRRQDRRAVAARVLVRYELWDEVFQVVAATGSDGETERHTAATFDELTEWWRTLHLPVPEAGDAKWVTVEVVPFSRAERDDAQRWFSESLDRADGSPTEEVTRSAEEGSDRLSQIFHLLLATSIERRPLTSYRFALDQPEDEGR